MEIEPANDLVSAGTLLIAAGRCLDHRIADKSARHLANPGTWPVQAHETFQPLRRYADPERIRERLPARKVYHGKKLPITVKPKVGATA